MLTKYEYKENLGNIFELFSSGLIFINDKGILLDMNSYAEKILDINKDDYVGNHANDLCEMFSVSDEEKKFLVKKLKKEKIINIHLIN